MVGPIIKNIDQSSYKHELLESNYFHLLNFYSFFLSYRLLLVLFIYFLRFYQLLFCWGFRNPWKCVVTSNLLSWHSHFTIHKHSLLCIAVNWWISCKYDMHDWWPLPLAKPNIKYLFNIFFAIFPVLCIRFEKCLFDWFYMFNLFTHTHIKLIVFEFDIELAITKHNNSYFSLN